MREKFILLAKFMGGSGGGEAGVPKSPPPGKSQNTGFLRNTGPPNRPKNHKATKPAFNVGPSSARQRNAILPLKCRYAGGPMMARF